MSKKKHISVISLTTIGVIGAAISIIVVYNNNRFIPTDASDCEHIHVEHYEAGLATDDKPGYKEHWACCNCHKAWADEKLTKEIGRTADHGGKSANRSKIDCYDIDWNKNIASNKYLYKDIAKAAETINFFKSESTDGTKCGETDNDLIYYSYDYSSKVLDVWSNKLIRFKDNDRQGESIAYHGYFEDCVATSIDITNIETSDAKDLQRTFKNCKFVTEIKNLDSVDASNATNLNEMFYNAEALTSLDLSNMIIPKATILDSMFEHCKALTKIDIYLFTTSSVFSFNRMFYDCSELETIYAHNFDFTSKYEENDQNMFYNCSKLVGEKGTTYSSTYVNGLYARVDKGENLPGYFSIDSKEEEVWNKAHGVVPVINEFDNTLTYGLYPQTHVNDSVLIAELEKVAPEADEEYFLYNNEYYVKDTGNPYDSSFTFLDGTKIVKSTSYFFKCEPIIWNIKVTGTNYMIDCSNVLYAHRFDDDSSDYPNSELRTWLNNDFYNKAFSIKTTSSHIVPTDLSDVKITGEKVWVGSEYNYSHWYSSNNSRRKKASDFALCNYVETGIEQPHLRYGTYWTRSPYGGYETLASLVYDNGSIFCSDIDRTFEGVSPCLTIKID